MRLKYIGSGNYFQVSGRELPVHEMYHLAFLLVLLVSSQARKRSRARRRRISFDFNCQSRCGKYNKEDTKGEYLHSGCTAMEGNPRKALILNANVYNHCIRYKIPSGFENGEEWQVPTEIFYKKQGGNERKKMQIPLYRTEMEKQQNYWKTSNMEADALDDIDLRKG